MIKRNLALLTAFLCLTFVLSGCLDSDDNKITYTAYALIGDNSDYGGTTLITSGGEYAAPLLSGYEVGDCVRAQYTINLDNQPSSKYYTATDIYCTPIEKAPFVQTTDTINEEYLYPLLGAQVSTHKNFDGNVFLMTGFSGSATQVLKYMVTCDPKTVDANGAYTIYLLAQATKETSGSSTSMYELQAFNMRDLIRSYGTSSEGAYTLKANIKYVYSVNSEGEYKLASLFTMPQEFSISR